MARPTAAAAAAGVLACAVVLPLFAAAGQSGAILPGNFPFVFFFPSAFPIGYKPPPPVRIYSKQNTTLNMAIDRSGKAAVILATATSGDPAQLWWKLPAAPMSAGSAGYWLVNVATKQAMTPPPIYGPVQMATFNPLSNSANQSLWVTKTTPVNDVFYQIKPYTQPSKALNALWGRARDGTVIAIWSDAPVFPNTLWVATSDFPFRL